MQRMHLSLSCNCSVINAGDLMYTADCNISDVHLQSDNETLICVIRRSV